ncbi:MAG: amidohydrolase family protein [Clostridiales bacterium]|nr:amidohydrolase family protein [Clostridiales bacterium]
MKIYDCHLTYGASVNIQPYKNCDTFSDLLDAVDVSEIDGGLVRCRYSDNVGVRYGNGFAARDVRSALDKGIFMRGVWAVLPPYTDETPKPEALFDEMKKNNIGAVYINPSVHRYVPDMLTLGKTLSVIEENKIPIILSTEYGVSMELIYKIMRAFPRLRALISDTDCWPNARRLYPLISEYENAVLDLSYVMDAGGIEDMTSRFGAEKLLFGTGFPARYPGSVLAMVRGADISERERELILGKNLENILSEANL